MYDMATGEIKKDYSEIFKDYRGVEVLSAYKPLSLGQLNWVIMSEIDKTEAFAWVEPLHIPAEPAFCFLYHVTTPY